MLRWNIQSLNLTYDLILLLLPSLHLSNKMFAIFALFLRTPYIKKHVILIYIPKKFQKLFDTIKVFYCTEVKHTCNCLFVYPQGESK